MKSQKTFAYVGSWTVQAQAAGGGIGIYEYNEEDGSLCYIDTVRKDLVPGIICVDARRGVLYCVDEQIHSPAFDHMSGGRVAAFSINAKTGALTELGEEQPSLGTLPDYLALDGTGNWLVAINHGDKQVVIKTERDENGTFHTVPQRSDVSAVLYPLAKDGTILPPCDCLTFPHDDSQIPVRLSALHSVYFAPDGDHCIMTNMKQDQIIMLKIDREKGRLIVCDTLNCPAGNWPRYGAFHPDKKLFYLNNEHKLVINTIRFDNDGKMEIIQTLDSTPELNIDTTGKRVLQSDMKISRDGRFIYNFCRGMETVTVFAADEKTGLLNMIQSLKLADGDEGPRGFAESPDGRFLLVANLLSGTISTLAVDRDGRLHLTGITDSHMKYPGTITFSRPVLT